MCIKIKCKRRIYNLTTVIEKKDCYVGLCPEFDIASQLKSVEETR